MKKCPIAWRPGMSVTNASGTVTATSLGYQYATFTTTQILPEKAIAQTFYTVPWAKFIPLEVGVGAWLENIKINTSFRLAGNFFSALASTAQGNAQMARVDVGVAPVNVAIDTFNAGYDYTVVELNKALAATGGQFDPIYERMTALKEYWDLGIQALAFLGNPQDQTNFPGLLTQSSVTTNTTVIPQNISQMSSTQFMAMIQQIVQAYWANTNSTMMPDTLLIPYADWNGLTVAVSSQFPNVTMAQWLIMSLKEATGNPNFTVAPISYCDTANNSAQINANIYCLYHRDPKTVRMFMPVDFTLSPAQTANNYQWQGVAFGQFTSPVVIKPAEVLYFTHS